MGAKSRRQSRSAAPENPLPASVGPTGCRAASDVEAQLAALERLSYAELKAAWAGWFRKKPPPRLSPHLLRLGIGWKIQERAFGGLSAATKRRLRTIRDGKDAPPALRPGSQLVREWHGRMHVVRVTDEGFEWNSRNWRSLSVIAREITGQRWSGPRFFGLKSDQSAGKKQKADQPQDLSSDG